MGSEMKMINYEIDLDLMEAEYGDEIMCAGWNPDIDLMCKQLQFVPVCEQMVMSADPEMILSELCLRQTNFALPYILHPAYCAITKHMKYSLTSSTLVVPPLF